MPQINEISWVMMSLFFMVLIVIIMINNFFFVYGKFKNSTNMILFKFSYMI